MRLDFAGKNGGFRTGFSLYNNNNIIIIIIIILYKGLKSLGKRRKFGYSRIRGNFRKFFEGGRSSGKIFFRNSEIFSPPGSDPLPELPLFSN